jgi:Leucine-rich repeat (LRR) protein
MASLLKKFRPEDTPSSDVFDLKSLSLDMPSEICRHINSFICDDFASLLRHPGFSGFREVLGKLYTLGYESLSFHGDSLAWIDQQDRDEAVGSLLRQRHADLAPILTLPYFGSPGFLNAVWSGKRLPSDQALNRLIGFLKEHIQDIRPACGRIRDFLANPDKTPCLSLSGLGDVLLPSMARLRDVQTLDLSENCILDLIGAAELPFLRELNLEDSTIGSWGALSRMTGLTQLCLRNTNIADLEPLRDLIGLEQLDLSSTDIQDVDALANLHQLESLDISFTNVRDVLSIATLLSLSELTVSLYPGIDLTSVQGRSGLEVIRV